MGVIRLAKLLIKNTKLYKYVRTCKNMKDRKHMRKICEKRIESLQKQVNKHEEKIQKEKGRLDTTKDYWKKEIDDKFLKQIEEDEDYLEENDGN